MTTSLHWPQLFLASTGTNTLHGDMVSSFAVLGNLGLRWINTKLNCIYKKYISLHYKKIVDPRYWSCHEAAQNLSKSDVYKFWNIFHEWVWVLASENPTMTFDFWIRFAFFFVAGEKCSLWTAKTWQYFSRGKTLRKASWVVEICAGTRYVCGKSQIQKPRYLLILSTPQWKRQDQSHKNSCKCKC